MPSLIPSAEPSLDLYSRPSSTSNDEKALKPST
jgi:hypothetical protein